MRTGEAFAFEPPTGWEEHQDGAQQIYVGPGEEVLIVSGSYVVGAETVERLRIAGEILENAFAAIKDAAADSDLSEIQGLTRRTEFAPLEVWSHQSLSKDGAVAFSQAAINCPRGVMLVTLESNPVNGDHKVIFEKFLSTITEVDQGSRLDA